MTTTIIDAADPYGFKTLASYPLIIEKINNYLDTNIDNKDYDVTFELVKKTNKLYDKKIIAIKKDFKIIKTLFQYEKKSRETLKEILTNELNVFNIEINFSGSQSTIFIFITK